VQVWDGGSCYRNTLLGEQTINCRKYETKEQKIIIDLDSDEMEDIGQIKLGITFLTPGSFVQEVFM
jgi:hypothetical protein